MRSGGQLLRTKLFKNQNGFMEVGLYEGSTYLKSLSNNQINLIERKGLNPLCCSNQSILKLLL